MINTPSASHTTAVLALSQLCTQQYPSVILQNQHLTYFLSICVLLSILYFSIFYLFLYYIFIVSFNYLQYCFLFVCFAPTCHSKSPYVKTYMAIKKILILILKHMLITKKHDDSSSTNFSPGHHQNLSNILPCDKISAKFSCTLCLLLVSVCWHT